MGLVEVSSGERARVTRPTPQFVIDALSGPARHMIAGARWRSELPERAHLLRGRAGPPRRRSTPPSEDLAELRGRARGEPPVDRRPRALRADRRRFPLRARADRRATRSSPRSTPPWPNGCSSSGARRSPPARTSRPMRRTATIFEAIAARDPDRAERAMRDHLEYVAAPLHRNRRGRPMSGFVVIVDFRLKRGRATPSSARLIDANATASVRRRARLPPLRRGGAEGRARIACCSTRSTTTRRRSRSTAGRRTSRDFDTRKRAAGRTEKR